MDALETAQEGLGQTPAGAGTEQQQPAAAMPPGVQPQAYMGDELRPATPETQRAQMPDQAAAGTEPACRSGDIEYPFPERPCSQTVAGRLRRHGGGHGLKPVPLGTAPFEFVQFLYQGCSLQIEQLGGARDIAAGVIERT